MPRRDFDFTTKLLREFFRKGHVQKTLKVILDADISGWEKWFQIEFSVYLSEHPEVAEWNREWPVLMDLRKSKRRVFRRVDLILRKKGASKDSYVFLQIKIRKTAASCIRGMIKDFSSMEKTKTLDELKSYWLVGIHQFEKPEKVISRIMTKVDEKGFHLTKSEIVSDKIGRTGFSFTVF